MTEHTHHSQGTSNEELADAVCHICEAQKKSATMLSSAILLGLVLLSASVVYGARFIGNNVPTLTTSSVTAPATAQTGQPAAAAQPTVGPAVIADRANEPTLGNKDAKVTVVEFADFQCPFCKSYFQNTFNELKKNYIDTGKIKYVFRHFPLTSLHVNAEISGIAAECANQQSKFWDFHNLLYTNGQGDGTGLDVASLKKYADQLGLNKGTLGFGKNKFNQCLDTKATQSIVDADQQTGSKAGVNGTPTFYVNGVALVGAKPFSAFQQVIDAALKK